MSGTVNGKYAGYGPLGSLWGCVLVLMSLWVSFFLFQRPVEAAGDGTPPSAPEIIKKIRKKLNHIKPFKLDFKQQVYSDEQLDLEESGEILFKDRDRLKWTYLEPEHKVFILQGGTYRFYDEEGEQLTVGTVKEKNQQWIWQLFFSDDVFPHASRDTSGKYLTIKRHTGGERLDIEIVLNNDSLPEKVIRKDHDSGIRMIFDFSHYRGNIQIPENAFILNLPEDIEIVNADENIE